MRKTSLLVALVLAFSVLLPAQAPNFSGTWKMAQIDPPTDPRNGRGPGPGGGGGGGGDRDDPFGASIRVMFHQAPQSLVITQTANQITVRNGTEQLTWTLDDKMTVVPAGDLNALKTQAHWEGAKLHLHFKKGMNWGRDILTMNNGKLVVIRDIDSGGGSTTFTITYVKQ